jgi:hypothetical protein
MKLERTAKPEPQSVNKLSYDIYFSWSTQTKRQTNIQVQEHWKPSEESELAKRRSTNFLLK